MAFAKSKIETNQLPGAGAWSPDQHQILLLTLVDFWAPPEHM